MTRPPTSRFVFLRPPATSILSPRSQRPPRLQWFFGLFLLVPALFSAACRPASPIAEDNFIPPAVEIVGEEDLHSVPVLLVTGPNDFGYYENEILLALLPTITGKVRVTRDKAHVLAVYHAEAEQWRSPDSERDRELPSIAYRFATLDLLMTLGLNLEGEAERYHRLADQAGEAAWLHASSIGIFFHLEVGLKTEPPLLLKVTYQPEKHGGAVVMEQGAQLTVRLK